MYNSVNFDKCKQSSSHIQDIECLQGYVCVCLINLKSKNVTLLPSMFKGFPSLLSDSQHSYSVSWGHDERQAVVGLQNDFFFPLGHEGRLYLYSLRIGRNVWLAPDIRSG